MKPVTILARSDVSIEATESLGTYIRCRRYISTKQLSVMGGH